MKIHDKTSDEFDDNAFKVEATKPYPMRKDDIEREESMCTVPYTVHTVHSSKERRLPVEIRMRRSIHDTVGEYCGKDMTYGQFYEEAAILFMDINPKSGMSLNVINPQMDENTIEDRMDELICIGNLEDFIRDVKRCISAGGNGLHHSKIKKLRKIINECKKINNRGEKLNKLINEALNYVN